MLVPRAARLAPGRQRNVPNRIVINFRLYQVRTSFNLRLRARKALSTPGKPLF